MNCEEVEVVLSVKFPEQIEKKKNLEKSQSGYLVSRPMLQIGELLNRKYED
jgi:hypothetical protein